MATYNLLEHFQDMDEVKKTKLSDEDDSYLNTNVFKDKKLNKLWMKAGTAGFNSTLKKKKKCFVDFFWMYYLFLTIKGIELQVLKEEFSHHQEKIDQYYSLLQTSEDADESKIMPLRRLSVIIG